MRHRLSFDFAVGSMAALATSIVSAAPPTAKAAPKPVATTVAPKLPVLSPLKIASAPPMWAVAYSPDGKTVAVGSYRRLLVFDTTTGAKTGDYPLSTEAIRTLAFAPDGKSLAIGTGIPDKSGTIFIVDPATGTVQKTIRGHYDTIENIAYEGNDILSAADDETIGMHDLTTGKSVATLTEHIGRCLSIAIPTKTDQGGGGDIFATGGADKAVKIWDAKLRRVVVNFDQSTGPVWCLTALPNPGTFVAGSEDGKLRIFQVRADGTRRANAPADEPDPRTGYMAREQVAGHGAIYAVATAPDYSHIVSGGSDGHVIIWPSDIGYRQHEMTEAKRDIWGIAVSPDSKHVAAASLDGHTRIYDLSSGALQMTLDANGLVAPPAPPTTPGANGAAKPLVYGPPLPPKKSTYGPPSPTQTPAPPTKK